MRLQYFTFFINESEQIQLFAQKIDKLDILHDILVGDNIVYSSGKSSLSYVHIDEYKKILIGRLGRKASIVRSMSPDTKFESITEDNWPFCNLIFNLDNNKDTGQKIAFEYKPKVFKNSLIQLENLVFELNIKLQQYGYVMSVHPVTDEKKFWDIIKKNDGFIEKLTFTYNTPNLFKLNNSLNEDLKGLHDDYGATEVSVSISNPIGKLIVPEDDFIKESSEYVTRGGGEYQIKIKGKGVKILKSKDNIKTKEFEDLDIEISGDISKDILMSIIGVIF